MRWLYPALSNLVSEGDQWHVFVHFHAPKVGLHRLQISCQGVPATGIAALRFRNLDTTSARIKIQLLIWTLRWSSKLLAPMIASDFF